jgi:hypothetical protein
MAQRKLADIITDLELDIAKKKIVLQTFPNSKWHYWNGFSAPEINSLYTQ